MSVQCKVLPRDSSTSFALYRRLRLSTKHDSRDDTLIDNRAMKQFAFCHSRFALCTMINYLQHWSYYMQHHIAPPSLHTPRAPGDGSADRINCWAGRRSECPTAITSTLPHTHYTFDIGTRNIVSTGVHTYIVHTHALYTR